MVLTWVIETIRMKFGKRLKKQIEDTIPEWRDKFLAYKDLKKLVRLMSITPSSSTDLKVEEEFIHLLNSEIEKFNGFFMEQEEEFIIRLRVYIYSSHKYE